MHVWLFYILQLTDGIVGGTPVTDFNLVCQCGVAPPVDGSIALSRSVNWQSSTAALSVSIAKARAVTQAGVMYTATVLLSTQMV